MKKEAEKTYNKLLEETQESVNEFAQRASQRFLDLESSTMVEASVFKASNPEFTNFKEAVSAERARRSQIANLTTDNIPEEIAIEILEDDDEDAIAQAKKVIAVESEDCREDCNKNCK